MREGCKRGRQGRKRGRKRRRGERRGEERPRPLPPSPSLSSAPPVIAVACNKGHAILSRGFPKCISEHTLSHLHRVMMEAVPRWWRQWRWIRTRIATMQSSGRWTMSSATPKPSASFTWRSNPTLPIVGTLSLSSPSTIADEEMKTFPVLFFSKFLIIIIIIFFLCTQHPKPKRKPSVYRVEEAPIYYKHQESS